MAVPVLAHICAASQIIPAVVGIRRFPVLGKAMRILAILSILACVQLIAENVVSLLYRNNYFLVDYYSVVELLMLAAVFFYSLESNTPKIFLISLAGVFLVYWVYDMMQKRDTLEINTNLAMASRAFLIAMSLIVFHSTLKKSSSNLSKIAVFWVTIGVILYSAGTLIVFGLSNRLLKLGRPYFDVAWHINWTLLIVANLMYSKGMLCKETT